MVDVSDKSLKRVLLAELRCIPCLFTQALNTVKLVTSDTEVQLKVMKRVAEILMKMDLNRTPANLSNIAYRAVTEVTGVKDPYKAEKKRLNELALEYHDSIKMQVDRSENRLLTAARAAIAGNVIDLGIGAGHNMDLGKEFENVLDTPLAINHFDEFAADLDSAKKICYIVDNCGEIVFDKIFIEELLEYNKDLDITVVVKGGPIINDATMEDAAQVGLTDIVRVIDTGHGLIGWGPDKLSKDTYAVFREADVIISKGQGNFESLTMFDENIYFLLKAKCEIVADFLGVKLGDWVMLANKKRQ